MSIIILVPTIIIIVKIIYTINLNKKEEEEWIQQYHEQYNTKYNYCKTYIASQDNYIYCRTHTENLKRINIDTKEEKIYTTNLYRYYNHKIDENNNFIYYIDANASSEEIHIINAATGIETKIGTVAALYSNFFEGIDSKIYYTLTGYLNHDYSTEIKNTYMYDPITKKYTKLNKVLNNIEYIENNKLYHIEDNDLYVYDINNKSDKLIYDNIMYYDYDSTRKNEKTIDKTNGMIYSIDNYNLYIFNIPETKLYFQDNSVYYQNLFIDNDKLYLIYKDGNSKNYLIAYINLTDANYNIIKTNAKIENYSHNYIFVKNNFAYYLNNSDSHIYKTDLINGDTEIIYDKYVEWIDAIDGDYLYFVTNHAERSIRLDINTNEYEIIGEPIINE